MRPLFPKVGQAITTASGPAGVINSEWYRALRTIWESLGWSADRRMYNDLVPQLIAWTGATFGVLRNNNTDAVSGTFHLPNTYIDGTDVYPYLVYIGSSGTEAEAELTLSGSAYVTGAAASTVTSDAQTPTADNVTAVVQFDAITGSALRKNSVLALTVTRGNTDDYAGDVNVLSFGIKFAVEGSGQEVRF